MCWRTHLVATLLFFPSLGPVSLKAQVPYGYLVVAEETGSTTTCVYANPQTGLRTELLTTGGEAVEAVGLAVDPVMAGRLYLLGEGSTVGTAMLQGSRVLATDIVPFGGGSATRLLSTGAGLLAVVGDGVSPGLWSVSLEEPSALLLPRPGARDVCVVGGKAYLISHAGLSRIDEVDLTTAAVRTLGTVYPELQSLGVFVGGALLAGAPGGELFSINRFSGVISSLGNPRLGAITAIASDPVSGLPYIGTDHEVYLFGSFSKPAYVAGGTILDLDVGVQDLPSWLFYGEGCSTSSPVPHFGYVDTPGLGTSLTACLVDAPPLSGAFLVAGFSRRWFDAALALPFPLSDLVPQVAADCLVQTDVQASWFTTTNAVGQGQIMVGVPDVPGLSGLHTSWQWVLLDSAAPGGLTVSHGAEAIVR